MVVSPAVVAKSSERELQLVLGGGFSQICRRIAYHCIKKRKKAKIANVSGGVVQLLAVVLSLLMD